MPPPTSRAAGPTSGITFKAPEWATNPIRTAVLEVHKEGQKIQEIELNKKVTCAQLMAFTGNPAAAFRHSESENNA